MNQKINIIKLINLFIFIQAILIVVLFYFRGHTVCMGEAVHGYLDIRNQYAEDKMIKLDGEWEFYPHILQLDKFKSINYTTVPGNWKSTKLDSKPMSRQGYGTYRLNIRVPKPGEYCLRIQFVSSAYRVFINGKEECTNGTLGPTKETERSSWQPRLVPFYTQSNQVELIIQVTNYHGYNGGILKSILFGNDTTVIHYEILGIIKSALFIGIFVGVGLYLIILNRTIHKKYTYVYLSIFCISSLFLESIIDDGILLYVIPNLPIRMAINLEYFGYIGQVVAMLYFIYSLYPNSKNKFVGILKIIDFLIILLIIFTPNWIYEYNEYVYIPILLINAINLCITVVKAIFKKEKYAGILFVGMCFLVAGSIIEILKVQFPFNRQIFINYNFYIFGVLVFLLCQTYVLFMDVEETFHSAKQAKDMEIAFLQAQISPHFLFNILNNIYYLMDTNLPMAKTLMINFCNFLRVKHKFDYRKNVYYSLREEMELVKSYVDIENVRLNNMVELKLKVDKDLSDMRVMPLILQPMVENSIKHGFGLGVLIIEIEVKKRENVIHFEVSDNGKGMGNDKIIKIMEEEYSTSGIGLKNINYRLMKSYQEKIQITSTLGEGTQIFFNIPTEV